MARKLVGTALDPNTSISISSIAVNGATIQTDANSGAITFIPKPTVATPNPVGVVVSPTGGITSVATTGGVANANAITAAATSNTAAPVTIDITTTAPSNGQALIWNSATSKFIPGNVSDSSSSSVGLVNRLINGTMMIDQRNSGANQTITAAAALAYTVDRWYAYCTGANVTGQRVATTNANLYRYQFTGASSVTAIGFGQRIESLHSADLAGSTATLAVDLGNSLLTTVTWAAYYANTNNTFGTLASPTRTLISSNTFTVNSTVTRYSTQISIPSEANTGIEIVFSVGAQTSGTWTIGNVQLEAGSVATSIERRFVGQELLLCQRYYEVKTAYSVAKGGQYDANGWIFVPQYMTKRVVPTITCSASFSNPTNRRTTTAAVMTSSSALDGATVFIDAEM